MKDLTGKEIQVGDRVAIAMRHLTAAVLRLGTVLEVFEERIKVQSTGVSGRPYVHLPDRPTSFYASDRIVVLGEIK